MVVVVKKEGRIKRCLMEETVCACVFSQKMSNKEIVCLKYWNAAKNVIKDVKNNNEKVPLSFFVNENFMQIFKTLFICRQSCF